MTVAFVRVGYFTVSPNEYFHHVMCINNQYIIVVMIYNMTEILETGLEAIRDITQAIRAYENSEFRRGDENMLAVVDGIQKILNLSRAYS